LDSAERKARKTYKATTKRKNMSSDEIEMAKDVIVPLKVVGGYSNRQIGLIVGISKNQVGDLLRDENLQERIAKLKVALPQAALDLMQVYLIEAVQGVVHVLRTSNDNMEILKAASEIFDRAGLPKASRQETTFEPPEAPSAEDNLWNELRSADPEIQEKAAQLRDFFEDGLRTLLTDGKKVETDGSAG
jgi:hypothetical protein